ncbi:MAG: vWA domain-containing protein [Ilumatobacteraceae bacterium]
MARRFTYSRWDGTQTGFDLDAAAVLEEVTDDLLYHGDVNAALRRLLQQGMTTPNGQRIEGLRDLMRRVRDERSSRLDRFDLGGVYQEIARELDDIVDEERHAIDGATRAADASGDERRQRAARDAAAERQFRLDMLPGDLAGKVRELDSYDFESSDAQQRFEQLKERLRSQLMEQAFDQMSSAMRNVSPEDLQRTKDMMAALNEMIERRANGDDPKFDDFMHEFGDFFPDNPTTLDELLEQLAQRMAAAQAMLNSMTPEQRAQLQQLSDQLLDDIDLRWQMDQLGRSMQQMFPQMGWDSRQQFRGDEPLGLSQAMQTMQELADLDAIDELLRNSTSPAALAEADLDKVRDLLGDDAAASLERLAELTRMLEEQGLIRNREGRLELSPKGLRAIGTNALRDLYTKLAKDTAGQHQSRSVGHGHERAYDTKPYEFGDPFSLDLERTIRNAIRRNGPGTPVRISPDDFEIERTEHLTRSSTVLMLDLSMSMPMRDNFLPAKKVAMALHSLITSQFPRDFMGLVGFSESAYVLTASELPEVSWDYAYGTNMHHGFTLARQMLARQSGTKQIIMITDGEPTAHIEPDGSVFFNYPPMPETVTATLREVVRCTREGIRINTFMLDATHGLRSFIEQLTAINRGRAFFTDHESLGDYVLVDFIEHKRQLARGRGRRAS